MINKLFIVVEGFMRRVYRFSEEQLAELGRLSRTASKGHVRLKALAVWHVSRGKRVQEAAEAVGAHRTSVGAWCAGYLEEGASFFEVKPGRGRKERAGKEEIESYLRQSPRAFGIPLTRWTLSALSRAAPGLSGMSPSGVWRALRRCGLSYERGQPRLHSPDPLYGRKKGAWTRPAPAR